MWLGIQRFFKLSNKTMLMITMGLFSLLPLYGLCGFFTTAFGFHSINEIWGVCVYHGLMIGAMQSYSRVLYAELVPIGKENEFFAFYQTIEKGSAWIGPLVTGAIGEWAHDLRHSFWFLFILILIPLFLVSQVKEKLCKKETDDFISNEKHQQMF